MSQQNRSTAVTVVGAGIGGLTAALLLAKAGATVTVVEQRQEPAELGAGLMLQPNGLAVLEGLGLAAGIRGRGRQLTRMAIYDQESRSLSAGEMPDFGAGLDHYVAVRRRDLHAELLGAVRLEPGICTRFGVTVTGADPAGAVRLADVSGSAPSDGSLDADLVVGADGVNSVVRTAGSFVARVSDRQTTYVRGLVRGDEPDTIAEYWTSFGAFGAAPVAPDLTYFYAAAYRGAAAAAVGEQDLAAFTTAWRAVLPAAGALLDRVRSFDDLLVNGVRRVRCRNWVDGRLVLLGDAAHAMAPNLGQGANSAMVDAAVLTDELGRGPLDQALLRYQRRRRRPVTRVQTVSDGVAGLSGLTGRHPLLLRGATMRLMAHSPRLLERQVRSAQQEDPAVILAAVGGLGQPSD